MKKYFYYLLITLCSTAFYSCSQTLEFDGPEHEPKQVLNSYFYADSLWMVELTSSAAIDTETRTFSPIEDATIEIYEEGELVETLRHDSTGIYRSRSHRPQPGKNYRIVSRAEGFPDVEAEDRMPRNFNVSLKEITTIQNDQSEYEAAIFTVERNEKNSAYFFIQHQYSPSWNGNNYQSMYISSQELEFNFFGSGYFEPIEEDPEKDWFELALSKYIFNEPLDSMSDRRYYYLGQISDAYKQYKIAYREHNNYDEHIFSEPQAMYTNIKGGYGIFAACNFQHVRVRN